MRQVKSLTPDRERRLAAKAAPTLRKATSTKGLKAADAAGAGSNDENSSGVSNVRGATRGAKTAKGTGRKVGLAWRKKKYSIQVHIRIATLWHKYLTLALYSGDNSARSVMEYN